MSKMFPEPNVDHTAIVSTDGSPTGMHTYGAMVHALCRSCHKVPLEPQASESQWSEDGSTLVAHEHYGLSHGLSLYVEYRFNPGDDVQLSMRLRQDDLVANLDVDTVNHPLVVSSVVHLQPPVSAMSLVATVSNLTIRFLKRAPRYLDSAAS